MATVAVFAKVPVADEEIARHGEGDRRARHRLTVSVMLPLPLAVARWPRPATAVKVAPVIVEGNYR